ncbi:MAG: hypothetical protein AAGI68_10815 [Planctomycetota bacterium]
MEHLTIPIPDGVPEPEKSQLMGWLTTLARQATEPDQMAPFEDDPAVRAEITRRIRAGQADADVGRLHDRDATLQQITATSPWQT